MLSRGVQRDVDDDITMQRLRRGTKDERWMNEDAIDEIEDGRLDCIEGWDCDRYWSIEQGKYKQISNDDPEWSSLSDDEVKSSSFDDDDMKDERMSEVFNRRDVIDM